MFSSVFISHTNWGLMAEVVSGSISSKGHYGAVGRGRGAKPNCVSNTGSSAYQNRLLGILLASWLKMKKFWGLMTAVQTF